LQGGAKSWFEVCFGVTGDVLVGFAEAGTSTVMQGDAVADQYGNDMYHRLIAK